MALALCVLFGAAAARADDVKKRGLSLDALPVFPPDSSVTFVPDQPKPGVSGPTTGYGPVPAKNGMDMPLLGLKFGMPIDSK